MRVLFVDDDDTLRQVLARELEASGCQVTALANGERALVALERDTFDVGLLDLRLPGMDGLELLQRVRALDPLLPVVLLTGHGAVPEAVRAMRGGAYDFLTKPVSLDTLELSLRRAAQHGALLHENQRLRELLADPQEGDSLLLGESRAMGLLRDLVARVAVTGEHVLVTGENGTGKELVARSIHQGSRRSEHPFVVVNCGAIPEALVESELFGHEKGAFTGADRRRVGLFEAAHGGTLFLDEIGELPLAVQPKLLRAVQDGEVRRVGGNRAERVDVRVVAATHRDLEVEVAEGRFREDLYYRVATLLVDVPALRERREDVSLLARHFLAELQGQDPVELTAAALERLQQHDWPGNVRELRNAVARLSALSDGPRIGAEDVERLVFASKRRSLGELPTLDIEELERTAITLALRAHGGNRKRVAGELGIAVKTLYNKIQRYGIDPEALDA